MQQTVEPMIVTPGYQADELAAWAAYAPLAEGILTPFGVIDPARLSQNGRIDAMVGLERLKAWVEAQQVRILAAADADPEPLPAAAHATTRRDQLDCELWAHESLAREMACALRWAPGTTKGRIHAARVLVDRLPATLDTMEAGSISWLHARSLVDAVRDLTDDVATKLEQRVLPRAAERTPGEFRADIRRGLAALDPRAEADKHEASAADRRVGYEPDEHAMAWLNAYLPAVDADTIMLAIQAVADLMLADDQRAVRSGELCEPRTADQRRADALTTICAAVLAGKPITGLGALVPSSADGTDDADCTGGVVVDEHVLQLLHNLPRWQGRKATVNVSIAFSTLAGLDDQAAELDGYGPIPADLARRIAADPTSTWRRLITDEHGQLLDYGTEKYRPPQHLIDFLVARDRTCTGIGCHRHSRRSDIEHQLDRALGGETNPENNDPKCSVDHQLKHVAGWIPQRQTNGSTRWTTPTGRVYTKPADNYPIDRTRPKIEPASDLEPPAEPDHDPPPF